VFSSAFQSILEMKEDTEERQLRKYQQLSALAHDFVHASKTYGKIIIQETFLPLHYKTIRPSTI
jgi:hypothetical protein